jgi:hypothetical protein
MRSTGTTLAGLLEFQTCWPAHDNTTDEVVVAVTVLVTTIVNVFRVLGVDS